MDALEQAVFELFGTNVGLRRRRLIDRKPLSAARSKTLRVSPYVVQSMKQSHSRNSQQPVDAIRQLSSERKLRAHYHLEHRSKRGIAALSGG